jgi:hypothetical protein
MALQWNVAREPQVWLGIGANIRCAQTRAMLTDKERRVARTKEAVHSFFQTADVREGPKMGLGDLGLQSARCLGARWSITWRDEQGVRAPRLTLVV